MIDSIMFVFYVVLFEEFPIELIKVINFFRCSELNYRSSFVRCSVAKDCRLLAITLIFFNFYLFLVKQNQHDAMMQIVKKV